MAEVLVAIDRLTSDAMQAEDAVPPTTPALEDQGAVGPSATRDAVISG